MSLINDALKRAEKSLNNNSSDQPRDPIPSFDFEPSGKNKKLFFIILIGGTLFFTVLILLMLLLNPPSQPAVLTPPPSIESAPVPASVPPELAEPAVEEDTKEAIEEAGTEAEHDQEDQKTPEDVRESPEEKAPAHSEEPTTAETLLDFEAQKDIGQEFLHGMVGLASRAFTGAPSSNQPSQPNEAKEIRVTEKEIPTNYQLSTAQETLTKLEKQSAQNRNVKARAPEDPIQDFVNNLSITGVMISPDDSQVLINNKVYGNRSIIDKTLNLRLIDIQPHVLTIRDLNGKTYTKEF